MHWPETPSRLGIRLAAAGSPAMAMLLTCAAPPACPLTEAAEALCTLPGIGPKVAACICLFSLDKHAAIPGEGCLDAPSQQ